ncbi:uncharacterized protein LOC111277459 [Durio zibethinus]|uniref:Uncharacterized protein LOC111277459 n=1 Tax=Durio zibethinus TaxID=66656 RepID=A0A6P5WVV7_DURZI|nr:uncharacterized protein LOC111277459 [Durio zibethinus]
MVRSDRSVRSGRKKTFSFFFSHSSSATRGRPPPFACHRPPSPVVEKSQNSPTNSSRTPERRSGLLFTRKSLKIPRSAGEVSEAWRWVPPYEEDCVDFFCNSYIW